MTDKKKKISQLPAASPASLNGLELAAIEKDNGKAYNVYLKEFIEKFVAQYAAGTNVDFILNEEDGKYYISVTSFEGASAGVSSVNGNIGDIVLTMFDNPWIPSYHTATGEVQDDAFFSNSSTDHNVTPADAGRYFEVYTTNSSGYELNVNFGIDSRSTDWSIGQSFIIRAYPGTNTLINFIDDGGGLVPNPEQYKLTDGEAAIITFVGRGEDWANTDDFINFSILKIANNNVPIAEEFAVNYNPDGYVPDRLDRNAVFYKLTSDVDNTVYYGAPQDTVEPGYEVSFVQTETGANTQIIFDLYPGAVGSHTLLFDDATYVAKTRTKGSLVKMTKLIHADAGLTTMWLLSGDLELI